MIRITYILALVLGVTSCQITDHNDQPEELGTDLIAVPGSGYEEIPAEDLPRFEFEADEIDVGDISQGTVVTREFKFTNVGKRPLLIANVKTTCGCTVSKDWPTEPIAPGEGGSLTVSFDSEGKKDLNNKPISIIANTSPETTVIRLIANVKAPN